MSRKLLEQYDVIIHGGGLYAGGLSGIHTIVKTMTPLFFVRSLSSSVYNLAIQTMVKCGMIALI